MHTTFITFLTLLGLATTAIAEDAKPPNVLLILSDDQTWTDYSFMGHPQIKTPHIDKLVKESLTFTHGYVPASLCCPSLATIITGRYPFQHGITGNEPPNSKARYTPGTEFARQVNELTAKMQNQSTLVRSLVDKKGYLAHQSGKWWMGNHKTGGFTHGMTHGDMTRGGRHGDVGLEIGRKGLDPIFNFIEEAGDKPFCLWYAPFLPHSPHNPPQRLLDKYKDQIDSIHVAKYYAMCEWFDETCGELLDHLDAKGKGDNTIVIYVCDNGWIQNKDDSKYALKSKRSQYDGGLRTPIMVRWRGHVTPAMIETPVSSIDIVPTVLAACGLPDEAKECNLPGINLMDLEAVRARKTIFGDIHLHNAVDINDPAKNVTYRWALRDGWKLIIPHKVNVTTLAAVGSKGSGEIELYNVLDDPTEEKNLAAENPEKVKELTEAINGWWPAVPKS
jgi:arylsulfatase A-like enzyme